MGSRNVINTRPLGAMTCPTKIWILLPAILGGQNKWRIYDFQNSENYKLQVRVPEKALLIYEAKE